MKHAILTAAVLAGALTGGGCATKKYVRNTTGPIKTQVDQVAAQTNKQGATLDQTRQDLEKTQTDLSATKERAMTADNHANDALNQAKQAGDAAQQASHKADQANRDLGSLRQTVANLDDYKQVAQVVIPFKFNKDTLTPGAKQDLDKLAASETTLKRYFIAVEGFTDKTGTSNYNSALSRRRADRVMEYLVAKHDVPVYRIHMIGLGEDKPADTGRGRAARAKNRRVEVTVYSADSTTTAMNQSGSTPNTNQ